MRMIGNFRTASDADIDALLETLLRYLHELMKRTIAEMYAEWYIADLVIELNIENDSRNVVMRLAVLVNADSHDQAYDRAMELGKQQRASYKNKENKTVTTKFRGLENLKAICDEPVHGALIMSREDIDVKEDMIRQWLTPKEKLSVFTPPPDIGDKPDYFPKTMAQENSTGNVLPGRLKQKLSPMQTGSSPVEASVEKFDIPIGNLIDVVALAVKTRGIRCKVVSTGQPITYRKVFDEVEGEILTILPSKVWRYRKTHFMTGEIQSKRIDIRALNLEPLGIIEQWNWDPEQEYWGESDDPTFKYFKPIIDGGARKSFEMEQVIPFQDPENFDSDPIIEAADLYQFGDSEGALKIIEKLLVEDLRCIDAHAHLGNWEFSRSNDHYRPIIDKAKKHYQVGMNIGELSLGKDFDGLLPWECINNRPFLRCMHGYGLSLWRLGFAAEAREIFSRMLWLNPTDNQGVRFLIADIDEGHSWYDLSH